MSDSRPYLDLGTEELYNLFNTYQNDLIKLKTIFNELQFRTRKRAKELEKMVVARISDLEDTTEGSTEDESFSNPINLYPWQIRALSAWKDQGYIGVVEAVTGAGKTHVALAAMIDHLKMGWKIVIVVPSIALQEQWLTKVTDVINNKLNNNYCISLMGGFQTMNSEFDILIAVSSSASRYWLLPTGKKGLIIADECHRYGAKTWSRVLEPEFDRRLGLTATYEREDTGNEDFLDPYFHGVCYSLTYDIALKEGVIANFKIAFVGVEFEEEELNSYEEIDALCRNLRGKLINYYGVSAEPFGKYMKEVSVLMNGGNDDTEVTKIARRYMNNFNKRRKLLANAKQKMECLKGIIPSIQIAERTILFSQTKDAAEQAVKVLVEANLNAKVLDATMSLKERKIVFANFEKGEEDIVAAPMLLDEGVDVPSADLAIVLASSRSSRQMIQRMGRVLRKKSDERLARIAIIYVKGTMEDPEQGAHETFIDIIRNSATDEETFDADDTDEICCFLNDWEF